MVSGKDAGRSTGTRRRWAMSRLVLGCRAALWSCGRAPASASAAVDALFRDGGPGAVPGAAVIAIRDGEILKRAGYGMADLERGTPIESDTAFRPASVSKQFTAMAIMLLEGVIRRTGAAW